MKTYTVICLKDNSKIYQKVKTLTQKEIEDQFAFWSVYNWQDLLQRWNMQPESTINKLKWIYF